MTPGKGRASYDSDTGLEKGLEVGDEAADQRLFADIRVADTRISGSKGDFFVEYRIAYQGLFEMIESVASSQHPVSCLVRQEVNVWRRFSEFVSLHQRLEGDAMLRPFLKGIENPVKLRTVSSLFGSKLSRNVTIQRSVFLVRYLNRLAIQPMVANSVPFRRFLAYDADSVSRSAGANGSSRSLTGKSILRSLFPASLDKAIAEGIKGAVNVIKNVLPGDSYQEGYFTFLSTHTTKAVILTCFGGDIPPTVRMTPQEIEKLLSQQKESSDAYSRTSSCVSGVVVVPPTPVCDSEVQRQNLPVKSDQMKATPLAVIPTHEEPRATRARSVDLLLELLELLRTEGKSSVSPTLFLVRSLLGDFLET